MRPDARIQAAIDILTALETTDQPADRLVRDYFRARRYAGSKDRAAVAERVFSVLRHRFSLAWAMQDDTARSLVLASVVKDGEDPDVLFTGQAHAPAPLTEDEDRRRKASHGEPPLYAMGEFPPFLEAELTRAFGDDVLREMAALQRRAPTDLRVNTLKTSRDELLPVLRDQGYGAVPAPHAPSGIRIAEGGAGLDRTKAFEAGLFEFQDEAAQIAAILVAPQKRERILDMAAGAGGKALALAALAHNDAAVIASDIRPKALEQLQLRATRAGARIETTVSSPAVAGEVPSEARRRGTFDAVLLDAPCSGTGTWRRQPELRWKLSPAILARRVAAQDELLDRAAAQVKPGGRLIYATCSILPSENQERVAAFIDRNRRFEMLRADTVWRGSVGSEPPPGLAQVFAGTPFRSGTDGFFTAILRSSLR